MSSPVRAAGEPQKLALKSAYIEGFNTARETDGESAFEAWLHSAAKLASASPSDDGARQPRLRALIDALAVLEGRCGSDDRTAAYAVAGAARAYVDSLTTADDGAARPQPAQEKK